MKNNLLYRQWCKNCTDFTLHERIDKEDTDHPKFNMCIFEDKEYATVCECGTQFSTIMVSEIPFEKASEQIERYKSSKRAIVGENLVAMTLMALGKNTSEKEEIIIIESDSGYEETMRIQHQKNMEKKSEFIIFYNAQCKGRKRNDKCFCGSEKKYKACCMSEKEDLRRYFNGNR